MCLLGWGCLLLLLQYETMGYNSCRWILPPSVPEELQPWYLRYVKKNNNPKTKPMSSVAFSELLKDVVSIGSGDIPVLSLQMWFVNSYSEI